MGEITGTNNIDIHQAQAAADAAIAGEQGKVATDVEGVFADGSKRIGSESQPIFNVSSDEFHSNMTFGRKRLRLKNGSPGQQYMAKTKYNRPFWLSFKNPAGETWLRKVK